MNALPSLKFPPGARDGGRPGPDAGPQEGFVDEAALHRLLVGAAAEDPARMPRRTVVCDELVLAADDGDYAGWQAAPAGRGGDPVFFVPPGWRTRRPTAQGARKRPNPPRIAAARAVTVATDSVRWWLAVVFGALFAVLIALLLLTLASRHPYFSPAAPVPSPSAFLPSPG